MNCWRSLQVNVIAMRSRSRVVGNEALRMEDLSIPSTINSFSSERCPPNSCRRLSSSWECITAEPITTNAVLLPISSIVAFESAWTNSLVKRRVFSVMRSYWGNGVVFRGEEFFERWTPSSREEMSCRTRKAVQRIRKETRITPGESIVTNRRMSIRCSSRLSMICDDGRLTFTVADTYLFFSCWKSAGEGIFSSFAEPSSEIEHLWSRVMSESFASRLLIGGGPSALFSISSSFR